MTQSGRFQLDWFAGASTELELYNPDRFSFRYRYSPAFRSTIRTIGEARFDPNVKETARELKDEFMAAVKAGRGVSRAAQRLGEELFKWYLPEVIQDEFKKCGMFIELGLTQDLVQYPWELMYDVDHLSLQNDIGRFIHTGEKFIPQSARVARSFSEQYDKLSILIVSVANPQDRPTKLYQDLPEA